MGWLINLEDGYTDIGEALVELTKRNFQLYYKLDQQGSAVHSSVDAAQAIGHTIGTYRQAYCFSLYTVRSHDKLSKV